MLPDLPTKRPEPSSGLPFSSFGKGSEWIVSEPWDILRGKDVFGSRAELETAVASSALTHWAPNCATFSRAREIPIKGVRNAPVPLRSEDFPTGIPAELSRLKRKARERLAADTAMADMAASLALEAHGRGRLFSLEHPGRSIALFLPSWQALLSQEGVQRVDYTTCMFEGSRRRKVQVLICNHPAFLAMGRVCAGGSRCGRTGERHLRWRPAVTAGRVVQFTTGDEREYPAGFCNAYAECLQEIDSGGLFLEVFSGPNAPLSAAVCRCIGMALPGSRVASKKGVKTELQKLADVVTEDIYHHAEPQPPSAVVSRAERDTGCDEPAGRYVWSFPLSAPAGAESSPGVETNPYRLAGVEAGWQPSYGRRTQLIPDGLNHGIHHLERALALHHPFRQMGSLKEDHQAALNRASRVAEVANLDRLKTLAAWKRLASSSEVQELQAAHEKSASHNARRLGRKPRTALMEFLGKRYSIEDTAVPQLCLTGLPIVGRALESPFFEPYVVPAAISVRELLTTAKSRRAAAIRRVTFMAQKGSPAQAEAIYKKTIKEVAQGTMGGPFTESELAQRHGAFFDVVPSFGLEQGVKEDGTPKYRRIDDHAAGLTNSAGTRTQKIPMAMIDYVVVLRRALHERTGSLVHLATEASGAFARLPGQHLHHCGLQPGDRGGLSVRDLWTALRGRARGPKFLPSRRVPMPPPRPCLLATA